MNKKPKLGLILFVVAVVAWFGLVRGQMGELSDNLLQAKVKNVELNSYNQRLTDVEFAKQQGEAIQSTLRALYLALPKTSQIPEALVMIESLGTSTGISFTTASLGTPTDSEIPVVISFTGSLDAINRFHEALYNNVRTAVVKSQSVATDDAGNLTVRLQLGLVYQGGTN